MTRVLLVHGWGFDAGLWNAAADRLADLDLARVEFGFLGAPLVLPEGPFDLVVGHSFGALWALRSETEGAAPVLSVNGFPCFTARRDFPQGVPSRLVGRMRQALDGDAHAVVDQFRERCGAPTSQVTPNAERLAWGLDGLARWDARGRAERVVWALAAADDPIVPASMTEASWPARRLTLEAVGGHLLPMTAPDRVARAIRAALAEWVR